jgi:hypothetical protein
MTTIYTTAAGPAFVHIGWKYYLVFIVVTTLMLPLIIFKFPETKGLSLEEIGALFGDKVAVDLSHLSEKEREEFDDRIARTLDNMELSNERRGTEGIIEFGSKGSSPGGSETRIEQIRAKEEA